MAEVNKNGLMAHATKAAGTMIKPTAMEFYTTQMAMSMKDNGRMTKQTGKAYILMLMVPSTTASGKKTNSMASVLNLGQIMQFTKVSTSKEKRTVKENLPLEMVQSTKETSK